MTAVLKALAIGRREDGSLWLVRLHGTHLLVAGATGAGKASVIWGLIRAMFTLLQAGLVRLLGADPKRMELSYGREIFNTYGRYAADPADIAAMLAQAVKDMQERAEQLGGMQRDHTLSIEFPFTVIVVDEVAFLTAYHPDKGLRERIKADLATLTTQGRAVGYCVVAALQDPRKEVMSIRNLFPDRIAMRPGRTRASRHGPRRRSQRPRRRRRADLLRPRHRGGRGVRPAGIRPRPGAGPRRRGGRCRHPRHGRTVRLARRQRRWPHEPTGCDVADR